MIPPSLITAFVLYYTMEVGRKGSSFRRFFFPYLSEDDSDAEQKNAPCPKALPIPQKSGQSAPVATSAKDASLGNTIDEKLVEEVIKRLKSEIPSLMDDLNHSPSGKLVSQAYDSIYRTQILMAQEFLNENPNADLSRVKCLLYKLLPREYFDYIEKLRQHQSTQTIINIMGGHNVIAPNGKEVHQHFHSDTEK